MQGKRIYPQEDDLRLQPGEYGLNPKDGNWYARTPNGLFGNLANHEVTENLDGTITVSPSILVSGYDNEKGDVTWHGYLERGIWRDM